MIVKPDTGYDTNATQQPGRKPNGWLTYDGDEVKLWVYDVSTGWSMGGGAEQSSRTRTYFARNFQQPSFRVASQFPSQQHMAMVAQLVRRSHKGLDSSLLLEITSGSPVEVGNRKLKGVSEPIRAEGYIRSFPRVHERHIYAPEVTFDFVIERIDSPTAWKDSAVKTRRLKSWHDIIEGVMKHDPNAGFVADPDADVTIPNSAGRTTDGTGNPNMRPR